MTSANKMVDRGTGRRRVAVLRAGSSDAGHVRHDATYVLPLKRGAPVEAGSELARYLASLSRVVEVIVVDGSADDVRRRTRLNLDPRIRHLAVCSTTLNGKVAGVCDGVAAAASRRVVIADDDVRYDLDGLAAVLTGLEDHDAVMPENHFTPLPWHARWDTGRTLLNRALGCDYTGTIAVRRDSFLRAGGYCGGVLFENLELIRTLRANGMSVHMAKGVYVERRPPALRQFLNQRVRQAYDSRAQPARAVVELALLPAAMAGARLSRVGRAVGALATVGGVIALAETGRRRHDGQAVWSWSASLWAPAWLAERAGTSWIAAGVGLLGGPRYHGTRLAVAAHRQSSIRPGQCPDAACGCVLATRGSVGTGGPDFIELAETHGSTDPDCTAETFGHTLTQRSRRRQDVGVTHMS